MVWLGLARHASTRSTPSSCTSSAWKASRKHAWDGPTPAVHSDISHPSPTNVRVGTQNWTEGIEARLGQTTVTSRTASWAVPTVFPAKLPSITTCWPEAAIGVKHGMVGTN